MLPADGIPITRISGAVSQSRANAWYQSKIIQRNSAAALGSRPFSGSTARVTIFTDICFPKAPVTIEPRFPRWHVPWCFFQYHLLLIPPHFSASERASICLHFKLQVPDV